MDYAHARHAGNAGDVVKHVALIAALEELLRSTEPLTYVETHAGDGVYPLASVGEWGAGVQQIWSAQEGLVGRYALAVRAESPAGAARPQRVPGSPMIAARMLRPQDRMLLHELDPQSARVLRRTVPQADVREEDGFLLGEPQGRALALIDPPYAQKTEWTAAARTAARLGRTPMLLWYPVKALTRPRALIGELAKAGVRGTAVELHWTPLRLKRDRLNGCGVIFANLPKAAVAATCAALVDLGPALQTHGEWGAVQIGF